MRNLLPKRSLVVGKHSGRNAVRTRLGEMGYRLSDSELDECYKSVMKLADANKSVSDRDLLNCLRQARRGHTVEAASPATAAAAS